MSLLDALAAELSGNSLSSIASSLKTPPEQTQSAVAAAIPLIVGALSRNAATPAGAQALATALDRDHSAPLTQHLASLGGIGSFLQIAAGAALPQQPAPTPPPKAADGAGILAHLFGSNQAAAAQTVAQQSGLDQAKASGVLSALAPLVMSALGTVKQQQNLDAGGLSSMLAQQQQQLAAAVAPMLLKRLADPAGDGIGLDDLARMGGMLKQSGLLGKLFG